MLDVAIIGGGPAGLAGALALVRSRKRVVLFDAWPPRNASAAEMRGFVTQDGTPPAEMRRLAREQLAAYETIEIQSEARVESITGTRGAFRVTAGGVTVEVRRVLLCTGIVDQLPPLPGYRELWGKSIFQCPNCHGWEVRDQALGYLAPNDQCADWSMLLRGWSRDLVVFTSGLFEVSSDVRADLTQAGVRIEERPVVGIRQERGALAAVQLADGDEVSRDALFARPPQAVPALIRELGVELESHDCVRTTKYETSIPGIYAAGDLMRHEHGALIAAALGAAAAHQLDESLTRELVLAGLR